MNRPAASAAFAASANVPATVSPRATALARFQPYVLSLLRIMAGLLFLEHGMAKLFGFPPHGQMPGFMELELSLIHI